MPDADLFSWHGVQLFQHDTMEKPDKRIGFFQWFNMKPPLWSIMALVWSLTACTQDTLLYLILHLHIVWISPNRPLRQT